MNILILGGSGILSTDFTKKCLDEGKKVYILNRGNRTHFIDPRAQLIKADLRNEPEDALREKIFKECPSYDVIIDFLSFNPEHLKRTLSILDAQFKQFIFISSSTAYKKKSEDEILTEQSAIGNQKWDYAYNKYLCEELLKKTTINYTIIRPYVTYGKNRIPFPIIPGNQYTLLARIMADKPIIMFEQGRAICTLTHTQDFAKTFYELLLNEKAYKEAFHITSASEQTWLEVYTILCEILDKKPNICSLDRDETRKYMPEFYDILIGDKGTNMRFDNTKVTEAIGHSVYNDVSLRDGLKQSVDFFMSNSYMQTIDYKFDGECDYIAAKISKKKCRILNSPLRSSKDVIYYHLMRFPPTNYLVSARRARKMDSRIR